MARKIITDTVFVSISPAFTALNEMRQNVLETIGLDITEILKDNLPTVTLNENGEEVTYPGYAMTEGDEHHPAELTFDPAIKSELGSLAIVALYDGETNALNSETAEPVAIPVAVYLLNLPKVSDIISSDKLSQYREELLITDLRKRARKLARLDFDGKSPLIRDRVGALLAAASRGGASLTKSFDALFPVLQGIILRNITAKVTAAQEAGQHALARTIRDTFSKARLNKDTIRECLSSSAGAKLHFPAMPQEQWQNLLRIAINWAPKHQVAKIVKDEAGNSVKITDPETGKETVQRELVSAPQNAAIFQQWLDTRDESTVAEPGFEIDLSDMNVDLQSDVPGAARAA